MSRLTKAWRNTHLYRRRMAKRLPQALIIGAQKDGTSALFTYLAQHPHLAPSLQKEVNFFGSDLRYDYGLKWYAAQWDRNVPANTIHFEASPQYLFARRASERIQHCLPTVKLIAILRDPVLRAYSAWQMYRQQLADDPQFYHTLYRTHYSSEEAAAVQPRSAAELDDFWLAIQREAACVERGQSMEWSVLEFGLYGPQLRRYVDLFPREQLLILDSNELRTQRVSTLNRVLHFLELPSWQWTSADLADVFVGKWAAPMPPRAQDFLREYYRESNRMLAEMLDVPPHFARDDAHRRASA
ncbi:MAG: sulfotransferase domain-containing protein [Pirellulales bacterium]